MDEVTQEMADALSRLTLVAGFDFAGAYRAAYQGLTALDPRGNVVAANMIYGRTLAMRLWSQRQSDTLDLRTAAQS